MKVFVSGYVVGSYRAQNILKALSDARIPFALVPLSCVLPDINPRPLRLVVGCFFSPVVILLRVWLIANSTHLIVLPMNFSFVVLLDVVVARALGKKVIVDFYISSYDTFVNDRKTLSAGSFGARLARTRDLTLLRFASKVVFLNGAEALYYQSVVGIDLDGKKIAIIPLCVDYKGEALDRSRRTRMQCSGLRVCWWGTYIPLHGLEKIIQAFTYLKHSNVTLHIFGDSEKKAAPYRALIEQHELQGSVFLNNTKSFGNGELAPFLSQHCDLALGSFGDSQKAKTVLVNKVVDALSLGIPCLTMPTRAVNEILGKKDCLLLCDGTAKDIANRIEALVTEQDTLRKIGMKGLDAYIETFSPEVFQKKFLTMLTAA